MRTTPVQFAQIHIVAPPLVLARFPGAAARERFILEPTFPLLA